MTDTTTASLNFGDELRRIMLEGQKAHAAAKLAREQEAEASRQKWITSVVKKCKDTINDLILDMIAGDNSDLLLAARRGHDSCPINGYDWLMPAIGMDGPVQRERSHIDEFPIYTALVGPITSSEPIVPALEEINNELRPMGVQVAVQKRLTDQTYYTQYGATRRHARIALFLVWDQESYNRRQAEYGKSRTPKNPISTNKE